ncbi:uncharacterized protein [Maniola hyperantus]|uniref:uncharacterized protein isoform X2 n=1 Tax=Aphantopus hyperantus TaxID=2795564 RepID=UPI003749B29E
MNQNTLSKLAICRTCLDTKANIPIFTEEMDPASYSGLVYTVTGVKVEMDDGLPQSICQNCVNNINNCLHFRKQCKEAETKLIIMKNKIEDSDYDIEIKLENENMNIGIENLSSDELELLSEKTEIKKEVNVTVENNFNDKHENFGNKKICNNKIDQTKDLRNVNRHTQNMEINKCRCKLCKKRIAKRKYDTHTTTKHKPSKDRTVMCNICNINLNKKQISSHKLSHRKNKQNIDNDVQLNNSTVVNFNSDNLINESLNAENDIRQAETRNNNTLNNNNENLSNNHNYISVDNSMATENDDLDNNNKNNDNSIDTLIDSEVDTGNNVAAPDNVRNEKRTNNKLMKLTNKSVTAKVINCFTNTQKDKQKVQNCFNDTMNIENSFNDTMNIENCFNDTMKVENCFKNLQKVENCFENTQKTENFINDAHTKTDMDEAKIENILYSYNDTNLRRVTCKLCQKDLSIRSVDSHMIRSHPGADKRRVKCDLCDNYVMKSKLYCKSEFANKEALVEHIASCSAKKKRRSCDASRETGECEVCHKTMQKGSLKLHHAMKHAGLRPVCEHCGKSFGNKFRLQDHYRAKHGYEKYKCSYCDFQSACSMSMRNHERRHRGEKPFVCESCGTKFHASYLLAQHRQSHATDKAFQCDLCPASFKVNNTLHMHKRACHSTCKYACTLCTRTYSTRHYVVKHMRAMHRYTGPVPPLTPVEC